MTYTKYNKFLFMIIILTLSTSTIAQKISDIEVADELASNSDGKLVLNGAGIRTKFFFDIYIGALYLPKKITSAEKVLSAGSENQVHMKILYKELPTEKLTSGWNDGFEENLTQQEFSSVEERLKQFNTFFEPVKKGDSIRLIYDGKSATQVWINKNNKGVITGADFNQALLKVWLGENPADGGLKEAMLSQ